MATPLTFDFADGKYAFDLSKIALLQELQDKTGSGPMAVFQRLASGQWRVADVYETMRLALVGGGTKPADAVVLVERYVFGQPLIHSIKIAVAVLEATLVGPSEPEGNGAGGASA
jgi:hypothetical protein